MHKYTYLFFQAILKKAKWNTQPLDLNDDLDSNDGSLDHNVGAWGNDRQYFSNIGRKRPAEQYSSNSFSPGKRELPSQSASPVKKKAKFNIHDKLRELYEEFSADESLQTNYVRYYFVRPRLELCVKCFFNVCFNLCYSKD